MAASATKKGGATDDFPHGGESELENLVRWAWAHLKGSKP